MKVLITGAAGFLGRAVVAQCVAAGHDVVAMVRPMTAPRDLGFPEQVTFIRADLRQTGPWQRQLTGVEAVIHLAAAVSGDLAEQFAGTVIATENLLASLPTNVRRIVHISSYSVYDYASIGAFGEIDERSDIEILPQRRDAYTTTKLIQERMVTEHCRQAGLSLAIIRPGAIYGPGKHWEFGRALKLGGFDLIYAPFARMKLTFVDNCADAIVRAVDLAAAVGIYNIVDSDLPSHARYHRLCRRAGAPVGRSIFVPWTIVALGGLFVRAVNRIVFNGRAKLPEVFEYSRQQARWKPLRYRHRRAASELGWTPRVSIEEGVARTFHPRLPKPSEPAIQPVAHQMRGSLAP